MNTPAKIESAMLAEAERCRESYKGARARTVRAVKRFAEAGVQSSVIQAVFGVSRTEFYAIARREVCARKGDRAKRDAAIRAAVRRGNESCAAIGKRFGLSGGHVWRIGGGKSRFHPMRRSTPEERKLRRRDVLRLTRAGYMQAEIASELGCSLEVVRADRRELRRLGRLRARAVGTLPRSAS